MSRGSGPLRSSSGRACVRAARRVRRRGRRPEIVDRVNKAAAHQGKPNAIDLGAGGKRIVWRRDPAGQRVEFIGGKPTPGPSRPPSRRSGAMARREGGEGTFV